MELQNQKKLIFQKETPDGLIEVYQENTLRCLSINSVEQTRIDIDTPGQLALPVYHAFLSSLLFIDTPEKVLLAGLGGGALVRYLHHVKPEIQGDTVEINETVAELAKEYFYFPETEWKLIVADIQQWQGNDYDLIVVDIAEGDLTPAWLSSENMLLRFKRQLSADGVLVMNLLVTDAQSMSNILMTMRQVFERRTLCLSVPDHKNIVVLAFKQQPHYCAINKLQSRINELTEIWGLDFKPLLGQLRKDNPQGSGVF